MIVLTVVSFNAAPVAGPTARFDELGGTIGRADNNQLVLPDPERTISRVHARILFRNGGYVIVDNGSNPTMVNGVAGGSGSEQALKPGDQIQIGGYVLAVTDGQTAASADPFADLFGDGLAGAPAPRAAGPAPMPAPVNAPMPSPPSAPPTPAQRPGAAGIPEDWDPFAPDPSPEQVPDKAQAPGDPFAPMIQGAPAENSLDDLFGLGPGAPQGDPLGAAAPASANSPGTGVHTDPLAGFGRPPAPAPATRGDLGSDLNTPMPLAPSRPAPSPPQQQPQQPAPPQPAQPGSAASAVPTGAVFSWEETGVGADPFGKPDVQRPGDPAVGPEAVAPAASPAAAPAASRSSAPASAPATAPAAGADALLQALVEGLGVPDLRLDALTPEKMRLIGQLLHEATRGTVELLVARAALKREMHADVTMIVARQNNPLKFSPTVDVALQHLLGAPMAGFMSAAPAMRDAFDDLRAHQLGVMAGMRAALEGVLQRFDPAQLEANLVKRSSISNLIPSSRKARLWELFQALFTQLQTEAQDDFDELFGKAFLRAYESQLERLRDEPGPR